MKIIKCGNCSRSMHVFSSAKDVACLFCGCPVDTNRVIDNLFKEPFLFLNDKLTEIDRLIALTKYGDAETIINDVLKAAPGSRFDELPNSGEVHWRKLLAEIGCKNDAELLSKGKPLEQYPSFINAMKYATEDEKPVYTLIEKIKNTVLAVLKNNLKKQELMEKNNTEAENKLKKYREEIDRLRKEVQKNITLLEKVEKELHERAFDYMAAVGEFEYSINAISNKIKGVGMSTSNISIKQRDSWFKELDIYLSQSKEEINNLTKFKSTNVHYLNYSSLEKEQRAKVSDIEENISQIYIVRSKIQDILSDIDKMTDKYAEAIRALENGNYDLAKTLITKPHLEKIIRAVITAKPSQGSAS